MWRWGASLAGLLHPLSTSNGLLCNTRIPWYCPFSLHYGYSITRPRQFLDSTHSWSSGCKPLVINSHQSAIVPPFDINSFFGSSIANLGASAASGTPGLKPLSPLRPPSNSWKVTHNDHYLSHTASPPTKRGPASQSCCQLPSLTGRSGEQPRTHLELEASVGPGFVYAPPLENTHIRVIYIYIICHISYIIYPFINLRYLHHQHIISPEGPLPRSPAPLGAERRWKWSVFVHGDGLIWYIQLCIHTYTYIQWERDVCQIKLSWVKWVKSNLSIFIFFHVYIRYTAALRCQVAEAPGPRSERPLRVLRASSAWERCTPSVTKEPRFPAKITGFFPETQWQIWRIHCNPHVWANEVWLRGSLNLMRIPMKLLVKTRPSNTREFGYCWDRKHNEMGASEPQRRAVRILA